VDGLLLGDEILKFGSIEVGDRLQQFFFLNPFPVRTLGYLYSSFIRYYWWAWKL
jgi:hypothetical protein